MLLAVCRISPALALDMFLYRKFSAQSKRLSSVPRARSSVLVNYLLLSGVILILDAINVGLVNPDLREKANYIDELT